MEFNDFSTSSILMVRFVVVNRQEYCFLEEKRRELEFLEKVCWLDQLLLDFQKLSACIFWQDLILLIAGW